MTLRFPLRCSPSTKRWPPSFSPGFPPATVPGRFAWLRLRTIWVEPAPLGKQRSRDPKDDPFLACALAAGVTYLVTRDHDLLALGKPFGIEIVTPARFLAWLRESGGTST